MRTNYYSNAIRWLLHVRSIFIHIYSMVSYNHLYKYKDYEEYKKIQVAANRRKIDSVWVSEEIIKIISDYLKENVTDLRFGICHGTRRGKEQLWFREYLGIDVIGTEISPTATEFPYTIEWDFHDVKDEWLHNVDFIYSNALDHSYKPSECLDAWMSCINHGGVCILEWTAAHKYPTKTDPFGGSFAYYKKLIEHKYHIKDVVKIHDTTLHVIFVVSAERK